MFENVFILPLYVIVWLGLRIFGVIFLWNFEGLLLSCVFLPQYPINYTPPKKRTRKRPKLLRIRNWEAGRNWDKSFCSHGVPHGTSVHHYKSLCVAGGGDWGGTDECSLYAPASPPAQASPLICNSGCHDPSLSLWPSGSVLPHVEQTFFLPSNLFIAKYRFPRNKYDLPTSSFWARGDTS